MRAVFIDGAFGDLSADDWVTDGTCDWLFELAIELDSPVMMWAPRSTEGVGVVAKRFPELRIMLDQMNGFNAPEDPDDFGRSLESVLELAEHPNIGVKLRLWDWQFDEPMRKASFAPLMERFIAAFGPERSFWCTDFMNHRAFSTAALRDAFLELPSVDGRAGELVMGEACARGCAGRDDLSDLPMN
jgi:predicted TIM-barrel fold metal-dependent hydrolase